MITPNKQLIVDEGILSSLVVKLPDKAEGGEGIGPGRRGRRKTREEEGMERSDRTPMTPHYGRKTCIVSKEIYILEKEDERFYHFRLKTKEEIVEDLLEKRKEG